MRLYLLFILISIVSGCTSIEVAKELTKASKSIKTTISQSTQNNKKITVNNEKKETDNQNKINNLEDERKTIEQQKKKEKNLAKKQQEIVIINFLGKTLEEIILEIGEPFLIRKDGNTNTARFDRESCRIFVFFNTLQTLQRVEHFEIRDNKGNLLERKEHIDRCYKKFKLA